MAVEKAKNVNASPAQSAPQAQSSAPLVISLPIAPAPRKQRVMSAEITAKREFLTKQGLYNEACANLTAAQGALAKAQAGVEAARTAAEQAKAKFERIASGTVAST
jgi:hypothetical protein